MRLSKPQKLIYDMEKFIGGNVAVICGSMLLPSKRDVTDLQQAVNSLYRLNDALRIRIVESGGEVSQVVDDYIPREIEILRFESKAELDTYAQKYAKDPLDFYGSLAEFKIVTLPESCGILVKLHHIIGDAWTLSLIGNQFNVLLNGETPEAYSYTNYLDSEDTYQQSKRFTKDKSFFLEQFKKCDEATYLSEKSSDSYNAERKTFVISAEQARIISDYAQKKEASIFTLFTSALAVYFNRVKMNAEKFYIGTAVLNRGTAKEKNTMGMFINTVPMLIELDNKKSFADNLSAIEDVTLAVLRHQKFNYGDVLADLRKEYSFTEKLYDVIISYQNATVVECGCETTWYPCGAQTESLQIHIDDRDNEGIFRVHYDYLTDKFSAHEIDMLHQHIEKLLFAAVDDDSKRMYELDILTQWEKDLLLAVNDTAADYPKDKCVHQLFEEQVEKTPDKVAVIACDKTLTYAELNEQANRIANGLIAQGVKPGDIVAFMLPRKSDLIAAMFGILKAGAAYLPIDPDYPQDRIEYMLSDSNVKFCISDQNMNELLATATISNPNTNVSSDSICYCIYTSGSTGTPKGTLLKHIGILNLVTHLGIYRDLSDCKRFGLMTTVTFDVASQEIFSALLNGYTGVLTSERKQTKIDDIIKEIIENEIDILYVTTTYFDSLTASIGNAKKLLSQIKVVCLAGEPFNLNHNVNFLKNQYNVIFENQYGPAETHVVTATNVEKVDDITIGKPMANTQIYIVDKFLQPVPIGITGELCIAGDCVGAGYLNRPELTAEKFIDNPFGEGKLYKTGDLAYWREDGNIVYVGRNDFQVKIRGLRIELGEIENAISSVDNISQAVVVVRKNDEGRQLICAFYTGNEIEAKEIRSQIGGKLPKYMLPHIITHIDEMPLTSSGKVNRKALPEVDLYHIDSAVGYVAPSTEQEKALADAISSVLNIEKVSVLDNFFDLGGDSLKAIELTSKLQTSGYSTDIKTIFDSDNVKALAVKLLAAKQAETHLEYGSVISATPAQMRVYTAQSMHADSTLYNIPYVFQTDAVDVPRLEGAVNQLIARHESLRTHFENRNGEIMQVIDDSASVTVQQLESDNVLTFVKPFDLSVSPLLRVGVFENTVMFDLHHSIADGGTMPVFFKELNELYMGRELQNAPVQYGEFAVTPVNTEESERYWLDLFSDEIPVLELNTDYPRTDKQSFAGAAEYSTIDSTLHNKIKEKCKALNLTPYVFYMAGFSILLSKYSGNEDIVIGMPVSGRSPRFLNTLGMFVNTVALRTKPDGEKTVEAFLREIRDDSVLAIANQNYPFGELVKKIHAETPGRNPLFDVMFAYQSEDMTDLVFGDKRAELQPIPVTSSKCDFIFNVLPRETDVVVMVEYCMDLYKAAKIQKLMKSFELILSQMIDEKAEVKNVLPLTTVEAEQISRHFNDTAVDYPRDKCVHQLFEEQVEKTPDKVAVIACDETLTYAELNEQANRIANGLIAQGVKSGDIVAFKLPRRSYLFAALFGILKTGAAYLPVDPDYPQDRINHMLADSQAKYCVTEENIGELLNHSNSFNPNVSFTNDSICYCIYTSGSTGKPKGTLLTHKNVVNYCSKNNQNVVTSNIKENYKTIVSVTTVGFDIFATESILPLVNGLEVVFANEEQAKLPAALNALLRATPADVLQTTPTKMKTLMSEPAQNAYLKSLKTIILGGEALDRQLVEQLCQYTDAEIYNIYGPTETTVWVSNARIRSKGQKYITNSLRIKDLSGVSETEKNRLLYEFNDTSAEYPRDKCVHQLFEEQAEKTPDKVAVIACDKTLTYAELNEQANRIANGLIEQGVKPGDIVAFMLPRRSFLIAAMIGILKAGAAYLPIDPDYPQDRIEYMLSDSKTAFCVSEQNITALISTSNTSNPSVPISSDALCYCIYTSGSTGTPKCVQIRHFNFVNFCFSSQSNYYQNVIFQNANTLISTFNTVFDGFGVDYAPFLIGGKTIVFVKEQDTTNAEVQARLIYDYHVDIIQTTPTILKTLCLNDKYRSHLKNIRIIMCAAESMPADMVNTLSQYTSARIFNGYGPSETTVGVCFGEVDTNDIHIGKPIANTQIYIVDKHIHLAPIGVTGELCIAGDCVGAGYLNRPELTAEKFIDNPFGEGKLYKTGDLAYWREDGNIVYVGRNDFQVKIRGLRIELGEIENAVSSVDGISQAVVVVHKNDENRQLICAFYTGKEVDAKEIRTQIGGKLPKYMLPHIITHIDAMPLTSSGKVNRKALPEVDLNNLESTNEFVPPVTEREKAVAKILSEILGIERVGLADDFFADLGCDSLKAIEFISVCHTEGIYFNLQAVFDHPTISELLLSVDQADQTVPEYDCADFAEIHQRIANNCVDQIQPASETPVGNILLTGATGYLGIHILADYLEHDTGTAYCIVRGKDIEGSKQRLNEYLRFYFGDKYIGNDRIRIFCGDLTKDRFGLSDEDYQYLIENTDTVINSVASVKHYGSYQFFYETNVESVLRQIEFCKASKAKLIHISTTSVAGNDFDNQVAFNGNMDERDFTEHDLFIGQPLDNVYVRSKFEAEKAVFEAMTGGLQANIMRMGNLTNRRSDGKFQRIYKSNAFLNRIKAIVEIGCIPDYLLDLYSEFTPIDDAANAVMTIARHFRNDKNVFHVENTNVLGFRKMLKHLHVLGIPMDVVNGDEFSERLKTTEADPKTKHIFETFINDLDMDSRLQYDSPIKIDTAFTKEYLRSLGFAWHETDLEYLRKYFEYFKSIGYIGGNDN